MNRTLLSIILVLLSLISCNNNSDSDYKITINLESDSDNKYLYLISEIGMKMDSALIQNGECVFSNSLTEPQLCAVTPSKNPSDGMVFILDYGQTNIQGSIENFSQSKISFENSKNNDLFNHFNKQNKMVSNQQYSYYLKKIDAEKIGDTLTLKRFQDSTSVLAKHFKDFVVDFAATNKNHVGLVIAISENLIISRYDTTVLFDIYNSYPDNLKSSFYGTKHLNHLNAINSPSLQVGDQIIDFTLNDINGKSVSIIDYRNKFVLIELWASWCAPCRAENPNLLKAYEEYNSKGFEIIGVSLDTDKDSWLKAIEKDNLNWTNLSDLKGWENELVQHYKINGVPRNILIDKTGKIIAIELRGADLQNKLKQIFEK
jgi:peroxiredoxin